LFFFNFWWQQAISTAQPPWKTNLLFPLPLPAPFKSLLWFCSLPPELRSAAESCPGARPMAERFPRHQVTFPRNPKPPAFDEMYKNLYKNNGQDEPRDGKQSLGS